MVLHPASVGPEDHIPAPGQEGRTHVAEPILQEGTGFAPGGGAEPEIRRSPVGACEDHPLSVERPARAHVVGTRRRERDLLFLTGLEVHLKDRYVVVVQPPREQKALIVQGPRHGPQRRQRGPEGKGVGEPGVGHLVRRTTQGRDGEDAATPRMPPQVRDPGAVTRPARQVLGLLLPPSGAPCARPHVAERRDPSFHVRCAHRQANPNWGTDSPRIRDQP